jgi:hypothetical protein
MQDAEDEIWTPGDEDDSVPEVKEVAGEGDAEEEMTMVSFLTKPFWLVSRWRVLLVA